MIVNAATSGKDKAWLLEKLDPDQVELQDLSPESPDCGQGTTSSYRPVPGSGRLDAGKAVWSSRGIVLGQPGFIARTGYR